MIALKNNQPTIIYLHLPKCAGNSIYDLFLQEYGRFRVLVECLSPQNNANKIKWKLNPFNAWRYRAVCAHMPYGAHRYLKHAVYTTILRHPVERVISSYFYSKENHFDKYGKRIREGKLTLEQFSAMQGIENTMTRWLYPYENFTVVNLGQHVLYGKDKRLSESYLEGAKKTLDQCCAVGIFEDLEKSICLFKKILGWSDDISLTWKNKTRSKQDASNIDGNTIAAIAEANAIDLLLYEYAKEKYLRLCREYNV